MPLATSKRSPQTKSVESTSATTRSHVLVERIFERITKRLGQRIRDLNVVIEGKTVTLRGNCSTYYSKQLAQHAALGVIEDETLANDIEVAIIQ